MNAKTFVDTNVLIYAYDGRAGAKYTKANELLESLWTDRTGTVSAQVLQEFYINVTRKIPSPLDRGSARAVVRTYKSWCIEPNLADIENAFHIEDEAQIRFWDALIVASASRAGATRLLSEDFNSGQVIRGVQIENPFR